MDEQILRTMRHMAWNRAYKELCVLFNVDNSEANVCPKCGYPKFKKHHEDFERCNGCDWTSK